MKQLLEKLTTLAAYTAAVCTIVILLVTSININCFNKGFYKTEYASLETAQSLGMTEKDLNKATDALLDYLQDRRDNIDVTVAVKGTETKAFNARESSHMVDVRNLYRFAMVLRNVAIILLVLSLAAESGNRPDDQFVSSTILFLDGISYRGYVCDRIHRAVCFLLSFPETSAS